MKRMSQLFLFVLCAVFFSLQIAAQSKSVASKGGDPRVAKALSQTKTEYEVEKDGIYKVTFGIDQNRSQTAFVSPRTDNVYGFEMRSVFSFAAFSKTPFPTDVMSRLLDENMQRVTAWAVFKTPEGFYAIVNTTFVSGDADGKRLDAAIQSVMVAADELEARMSKEDKL